MSRPPSTGRPPEVRVVAAWHEALSGGDTERLVDLSHPEIEVGGPHGTGRGAQLLRDWALRASIRLAPTRVFHRKEAVVVEQPALQGHGQALLDALHRRAAELGYSTLRLDTAVRQRAARSLYERNGYREIRRGRIGPFDCIFYERNAGA